MGKTNNYSQQFDDDNQSTDEWDDEVDFQEESVDEPKARTPQDGKDKGKVRRNIEDFKEQQELKALLGDDLYD